MVLAEFGKYCEKRQQEVGTRITQLTANKFHRLLRYMTEYIRQVYGKEDLPLETIDYAYVDGLNTYMQTAYNCHNNGAVNLLCCLKNFLLYAVRNEWIEKNPFRYYKMKIDKTNVKVPLTKAELDLLLRRQMPNERLDRIRDVFCFCALTGLAFTDVQQLKADHLVADIHGKILIRKARQKTKIMCNIPLLDEAQKIIDRYRDHPYCQTHGVLLPVCSNQKMNSYLKELADICGIRKNLSTHCARH